MSPITSFAQACRHSQVTLKLVVCSFRAAKDVFVKATILSFSMAASPSTTTAIERKWQVTEKNTQKRLSFILSSYTSNEIFAICQNINSIHIMCKIFLDTYNACAARI